MLDPSRRAPRLRGEAAVAKLSDGALRDSLRLLFPAGQTYWGDVAYVAERMLTVDELKSLRRRPAGRRSKAPIAPTRRTSWLFGADDRPRRLRALLARRLVRQGRIGGALPIIRLPRRWSDNPDDAGRTGAVAARTIVAGGRGRPADLALAQRLARRGAVQGRHAHAHARAWS